jgi:hypothetical protein
MKKSQKFMQRHSVEPSFTALTWALFTLGSLTLVLGFLGFMEVPSSDKGWLKIHGAALKTIQLFTLNVGPSDLGDIWQTRLASVIAPMTTIGAALAAFGGRLTLWNRRRKLRINPADDLFLGGGRTAAAIVQSALGGSRRRLNRVGVNNTRGAILEEAAPDCIVFHGDAMLPDTLKGINASGAEQVWIVAGDDDRNISILRNLISVDQGCKAKRRWFVEVSDRDTLQRASTLFKTPENVVVDYFNIERLAARGLMQNFSEAILPGLCATIEEPPILHICVIGSSELAEAIVAQSIQQLVVSDKPEQCLRLTWIAADASECLRKLRKRIPVLNERMVNDKLFAGLLPLADIDVHDLDERNISPIEWAEAQQVSPFSAVYIACSDELLSAGAMFRVTALRDMLNTAQERPYSICVCHWRQGLHDHEDDFSCNNVRHFYVLREVFKPNERYPGENMDGLAKMINAYWMRNRVISTDDAMNEGSWTPSTAPDKWSSRMGADHAKIQEVLGAAVANPGSLSTHLENNQRTETAGLFLRQARLEHRRFLVERLVEGWLPLATDDSHSGVHSSSLLEAKKQKEVLHLNATLVPYDRLPPEMQSKLFDYVRDVKTMSSLHASSLPTATGA